MTGIRPSIRLPLRSKIPRGPSFVEKECLSIYWKIKNFSYCWKNIKSPEFTYSGEQWRLQLDPKNIKCEIACLYRFRAPRVEAQISFLTFDGSQEESMAFCSSFQVSKDTIFGQRRSAFLPEDTLTVRCRIMSDNERGNISIRSRIAVNRKCFLWTLKKFSEEGCNKKLSVEKSDQYGDIQLNLKSVGGIITDKQFFIEISRTGGEECNCALKVSVLDVHGKALNYVSDEFAFEKEDKQQFWRFPPVIRNSKVLACKTLLLPNDTLSLKCDFAVTLGTISEQTIVFSYYNDVTSLLKVSDNLSTYFKEGSVSDSVTDLKTDLKSILDNGKLCDVSLQVGCDVIQAHKNILSARSPVFKDMFTKDMKETIDNVVIDDLDADTVRRLLLYMYSDAVYDYQWENIIQMYFAAIKYEVLSLKLKCSSFLKEYLSFSNVCDVLVLADLHQDADLKSSVLAFIFNYDSEIFASEAWKELEKNNSSLAFQTLRDICSNKRLD